jgi:hypothetical protein
METKFKVGDRVRHETLGNGTITLSGFDPYCSDHKVDFGVGGDVWLNERVLTLIDPASDMANPTASPTPDRAMIAAMCLQGYLSIHSVQGSHNRLGGAEFDAEMAAKCAVAYADALIAELQKPKQ